MRASACKCYMYHNKKIFLFKIVELRGKGRRQVKPKTTSRPTAKVGDNPNQRRPEDPREREETIQTKDDLKTHGTGRRQSKPKTT
jgi:hypothetical protein